MKSKLLQQKMRDAKKEREASKQEGYISKSVRFIEGTKPSANQEENYMNDEYYDSDELVYDSEEEEEEERKFME